jgi:hypothetical protein
MIENINGQLRRSTRNRGHFSCEALLKVLYLGCKEMGRTTRRSSAAAVRPPGRQHWPSSTSCSQPA